MRCRVCGGELEPLLMLDNMPSVAQHLPTKADLAKDAGVYLDVRECAGCGLVQLAGEPPHYYREVIRSSGLSDEMMAFRRRQFAEWIEKCGLRSKEVMEIGCGCGEYLEILNELDVAASGMEFSWKSVNRCADKGLRVWQGFGEPPWTIDAFVMLAFLEHLPEPNEMLGAIRGSLAEGGVGLVEVPNFDMIAREGMFAEFMADHLMYFTASTLRRTLELNGFDVLEVRPVWHDYMLSAVVRKRAKLDLWRCMANEVRVRADVEAFLARHGDLAIWGAGHQALAMMASMKLGGRVRYVVDSSPAKQGRYTPATHIPIRGPDALKTEPPKALIVACAAYSDEVVKIIRKDHAFPVSILRANGLEAA